MALKRGFANKLRARFSPSEVVPQNDARRVFQGRSFCGLFFGNLVAARVASLYSMRNAPKHFFGAERVR